MFNSNISNVSDVRVPSLDYLVDNGTITNNDRDVLLEALKSKKSILIFGGVGTGKTTLLKILMIEAQKLQIHDVFGLEKEFFSQDLCNQLQESQHIVTIQGMFSKDNLEDVYLNCISKHVYCVVQSQNQNGTKTAIIERAQTQY